MPRGDTETQNCVRYIAKIRYLHVRYSEFPLYFRWVSTAVKLVPIVRLFSLRQSSELGNWLAENCELALLGLIWCYL